MSKEISALAAGILFGLGLAVSHMVDPAKVLGFLDIAGAWDPSLAFVMAGALVVTFAAFRIASGRPAPFLAKSFPPPARKEIDARLVGGAAIFGVGWGLVGFCPGPAVSSLAFGLPQSLIFVGAMVIGMAGARMINQGPAVATGTS